MTACAKAIAVKADNAMLYGTGLGAEIKGIMAHDNINKIDHAGKVDYSMLLRGIGATKGTNIEPIDIIYNTTLAHI